MSLPNIVVIVQFDFGERCKSIGSNVTEGDAYVQITQCKTLHHVSLVET